MNPADYREPYRPYLEPIQSYAEARDVFRNRWRLANFRFRWSSWIVAALLVAPLAWVSAAFSNAHVALKGVVAVMALIAVAPLLRDFSRPQCTHCGEQPERLSVQRLNGDGEVITVCHRCRVLKAEEADSSPLTL